MCMSPLVGSQSYGACEDKLEWSDVAPPHTILEHDYNASDPTI
jgi:hypothetical protein